MNRDAKSFEEFGRAVFDCLRDGRFMESEDGDELTEKAWHAGLVERVKYEPADHGFIEEAEPGDEIWWFREHVDPQWDTGEVE